jgi:RNA polymerase sigma-70 factor, ECF subfamily
VARFADVEDRMDDDAARRARFEQVAREVWTPLHAYVARRASRPDVDDIVNETLTTVWRRLDDLPADATLPWVYAVARRTLSNHRRSERRRTGLFDRVVHRTRPADLATTSGVETDGDPDLTWALAQLPDDDVELARLWAWEQLEPREIGLVLGISANTASARLSRLRRRLQQLLETRHDPVGAGHNPGADQAERNR